MKKQTDRKSSKSQPAHEIVVRFPKRDNCNRDALLMDKQGNFYLRCWQENGDYYPYGIDVITAMKWYCKMVQTEADGMAGDISPLIQAASERLELRGKIRAKRDGERWRTVKMQVNVNPDALSTFYEAALIMNVTLKKAVEIYINEGDALSGWYNADFGRGHMRA